MNMLVFVILVHVSHHASTLDVYEGDQILLSCEFPTFDMDNPPTVVWSRSNLRPSTVHQRQQKGDELKNQNQLYRDRTSMRTDALQTGDLSLTLIKLDLSDSGTYTCSVISVRGEQRVTEVQLQVKEQFPYWAKVLLVLLILLVLLLLVAGGLLVHFRQYFISVYQVEVDSGVESVLLPCKTIVCLPVDKVEWSRRDPEYMTVHLHMNGSDHPEEQNSRYRGRTEMKRNLQKTTDLSLTLKHPTDRDKDTFFCTAYRKENILIEKRVILQVKVCQVEVEDGVESVQLPFRTTGGLPEDVRVEWTRYEPKPTIIVHVYHGGSDQPGEQGQFFTERTEMNEDLLKTGDLSLTLKNPTMGDTGRYRCDVYRVEKTLRKKTVLLNVKERTQDNDETIDIRTRTSSTDPTPLMADQSV